MLSVLILTAASSSQLQVAAVSRSLAVLVPHAVDGMVRDVHIVTVAPSAALVQLAEDAGAIIHASLADAVPALKSERVLVLQAGMLAASPVMEEIWQRGLAQPAARGALIASASGPGSLQTLWRLAFPFIGGAVVSRQQLSGLEGTTVAALHPRLKAPLRLKATLHKAF